jgi:hypothetical protein
MESFGGIEILTRSDDGFAGGKVSTGLMHATPGDMKSFKSSAESIALIFLGCERDAPLDVMMTVPLVLKMETALNSNKAFVIVEFLVLARS